MHPQCFAKTCSVCAQLSTVALICVAHCSDRDITEPNEHTSSIIDNVLKACKTPAVSTACYSDSSGMQPDTDSWHAACNRQTLATFEDLQRLAVSATAVAPRSTPWLEHSATMASIAAVHTGGRARQARARARTAVRKLLHSRGGAGAISTARLTLRTHHNGEPTNAAVGLTLHALAYPARMRLLFVASWRWRATDDMRTDTMQRTVSRWNTNNNNNMQHRAHTMHWTVPHIRAALMRACVHACVKYNMLRNSTTCCKTAQHAATQYTMLQHGMT